MENTKPKINKLKLNVLLDITKSINNNLSTDKLLKKFEQFLLELNIGKLALYSNNKGWKCILKYGYKEELEEINVAEELLPINEIISLINTKNPHFKPYDVIVPVFHKSQPLAYLLIGDVYKNQLEISPVIKHLPFIQTLTNIIIVAIENKRLAKEHILQEGIRKEMELASQMQAMLFPSKLPQNEKLEMAGFFLQHDEVGGDYYDFIWLNENEIAFCIADVSGKGVSAALLMSNFQANIRALSNKNGSLTDLVRELNTLVLANAKGEKFITLFVAKYHTGYRVLNYINAGHNPPILFSENKINFLETGCTGLGMFDELPLVKEGSVTITPNAMLACYTDGVVELENESGQNFGIENFSKIISENKEINVNELKKIISEKLISYKGKMPYFDDIALLLCRMF